jgi:hypothetical protein
MAEKTLLERVEEAARRPVPDDNLKNTTRSERDAEHAREFEQKTSDRSDYASVLSALRR